MRFTLSAYKKLVKLVKQRKCLYDPVDEFYKDVVSQKVAWDSVATEMGIEGMTGDAWKKAWRQKRDAYMRRKRKLKRYPSGGPEAQSLEQKPLFHEMSFLDRHIGDRSSVSNINNCSHDSTASSPPASPVNQGLFELEVVDFDSGIAKPAASENDLVREMKPRVTPTKIIRKRPHPSADVVDTRQQQNATMTSLIELLSSKVVDEEDDNFLSFFAKKMKFFQSSTQEWIEEECMRIYAEAKRRDKQT